MGGVRCGRTALHCPTNHSRPGPPSEQTAHAFGQLTWTHDQLTNVWALVTVNGLLPVILQASKTKGIAIFGFWFPSRMFLKLGLEAFIPLRHLAVALSFGYLAIAILF